MGNECKRVSYAETADFLKAHDCYRIVTHAFPDGDTLGSGFGLCALLRGMGKRAQVVCPDEIPEKFRYLKTGDDSFDAECTVAVDLADLKLAGRLENELYGNVDLCIDHHFSNTCYAKALLLDPDAAAVCECIFELAKLMGAEITPKTATVLYTGISTDTGCFRFTNTTARSHKIAAELLSLGADFKTVNRLMFETNSRARLELERRALGNMEYWFSGKCATLPITLEMQNETGCDQGDLEGISSLPRTVEGVVIGITFREKPEGGVYKISVRTHEPYDASAICKEFGGGGHVRAAGCTIDGPYESAKEKMLAAVNKYLEN